MDHQLESVIESIFGEPLTAPAAREQRAQAFATAEDGHTKFFKQAELDRLTGRSASKPLSTEPIDARLREALDLPEVPQTFTKASKDPAPEGVSAIPHARQKFLDSVDRFIAVARGGSDAR